MQIKTLRMENFRQFRGINKIDFSCDFQKNVTIVLGDNTFGKTTLLQAFLWCFYGKSNFDKKSTYLLNYELADEMKNEETANVEVELVVIHEDIEYIITRTQSYTCANGYPMAQGTVEERNFGKVKVSYKDEDGQTQPVSEKKVAEIINNILPEDLSNYFFFDIERVNSITTRKDIAEAVKGLLGLSIIDNAVKHLGDRGRKVSVIGAIYGKMDVDSESKAQNLLSELRLNAENRSRIAEQIKECQNQLAQYEKRKENLSIILSENEKTAKLQNKKESLEKKIAADKKVLAKSIDSYFREFNSGALPFFTQPLLKKVEECLQNFRVEEHSVQHFTKLAILELIKRHRCICGREFQEGDDVHKHLLEEMKFLPSESEGNVIDSFREQVKNFSAAAKTNYSRLKNAYETFLHLKSSIQSLEDEIESINEKISGGGNVQQYLEEFENILAKIQELNSKKDRLNQEDGVKKNDAERLQKAYDAIISASSNNQDLLNFIGYAEKIREYLDNEYKNKETSIREHLEKKVNEIFSQMYSGKRRVVIDAEYNVHLLTSVVTNEIETGESEGLNCVKNFAFIGGLVSLAKNKIVLDNSKKSINLAEEPYPLIMDAPFSNADEMHIANISKVLPEIAEQVIMFVMQKDWNYAKSVLENKVGKKYYLDKVSETHTRLCSE